LGPNKAYQIEAAEGQFAIEHSSGQQTGGNARSGNIFSPRALVHWISDWINENNLQA